MSDLPKFVNADRAADLQFAAEDIADDAGKRADWMREHGHKDLAAKWDDLAQWARYEAGKLDDLSTAIAEQNSKENGK